METRIHGGLPAQIRALGDLSRSADDVIRLVEERARKRAETGRSFVAELNVSAATLEKFLAYRISLGSPLESVEKARHFTQTMADLSVTILRYTDKMISRGVSAAAASSNCSGT